MDNHGKHLAISVRCMLIASSTWKTQKPESSKNSTRLFDLYYNYNHLPLWVIVGSTSFTRSLDPLFSKCILGHTEVRLSRGVGYPDHWRYLPSSHAPVHIRRSGVWFLQLLCLLLQTAFGGVASYLWITHFPPWILRPPKDLEALAYIGMTIHVMNQPANNQNNKTIQNQ